MSALDQIFTRNIQGSFPIYPVSLSLFAFTPTAATVTLVKFDPRCHVNQITRKWHLGPPPNFLSGISPLSSASLFRSSARIHIYGSYTVWGEMDHGLPCNYNYSKTVCQRFTKFSQIGRASCRERVLLVFLCSHSLKRQLP